MAQEERLLTHLKDRQHFVEGPDMYSLQVSYWPMSLILLGMALVFLHLHPSPRTWWTWMEASSPPICPQSWTSSGSTSRPVSSVWPRASSVRCLSLHITPLHRALVQVCVNTDTLFPFSPLGEVCGECEAVLHRECARAASSCPRCG